METEEYEVLTITVGVKNDRNSINHFKNTIRKLEKKGYTPLEFSIKGDLFEQKLIKKK